MGTTAGFLGSVIFGGHPTKWEGWVITAAGSAVLLAIATYDYLYTVALEGDVLAVSAFKTRTFVVSEIASIKIAGYRPRVANLTFRDGTTAWLDGTLKGFKGLVETLKDRAKITTPIWGL
jgi:hypothetical protein